MPCFFLLALAVVGIVSANDGLPANGSSCKSWEFRCENGRCLSPNRYCDGTDDCGDSSDETLFCTNCNQSLMGEVGTKYPLRITEPFQRNLPFACTLHLVAGGGTSLGDLLEITFLSFQIGSLSLGKNGSEDRLECRRGYLRLSESHEDLFLGDDGSRSPGSTLRSQQTRGFSQLISAFKEPPSRQLSSLYDYTANMEPDFGLFCGSLIPTNLGVAFYSTGNNVTMSVYLPSRSSVGASSMMGSFGLYLTYRFLSSTPIKVDANGYQEAPVHHLGNPIANSYCDRTFVNCDRKRCLIRSPNFPGLYLRNFTCNYFLRQDHVPPGKRGHIVVSQPNEYKVSVNAGSSLIRSDPRKALNQGTGGGLSTDCAGDVVRIYDRINTDSPGGRLLLTEFCESGSLTEVVSSGPEMLVQLYSAPSNLLYESRLELEVRVEFVDAAETDGQFQLDRDSKCELAIDGSVRRSGTIRSPRHSIPRNTTCTAILKGSDHQRVWLYFVSYFVQDHDLSGFDHHPNSHHPSSTEYQRSSAYDDTCDISSLELQLLAGRSNSSVLRFCEKTIPVICARAADYEDFVPRRPCLPPSESYISAGRDLVLSYSFHKRSADVVSSLSATSFIARYEFVDVESATDLLQNYTKGSCDKNISEASGRISSTTNLFFYGRGGSERMLCDYRFNLKPRERVLIEIVKYHSIYDSCTTYYDSLFRRLDCHFRDERSLHSFHPNVASHKRSFLTFTESTASSTTISGCLCDGAILNHPFISSLSEYPSTVTMRYDVSGMTSFEDFEDFAFEVRYRIIEAASEEECSVLPNSRERNRTHGGELTFRAAPTQPSANILPLRCRWMLQTSSTDTYLYLQLRGKNCKGHQDLNRVVIYSSGSAGVMHPRTVLCLSPSGGASDVNEALDFFSSSWHNSNESSVAQANEPKNSIAQQNKNQSFSDRLIVELMMTKGGTLTIRWLEVTRPSSKSEVHLKEGQTMKNVNCLFECPELSACINPELWCDGIVHCPHSGFDESSENCQQTVVLYLSIGLGCLGLCVCVGLVVFFVFRRLADRRGHQQTHPVNFGQHHPHCLQHSRSLEVNKNFQNSSPVFIVGGHKGSAKKKKKKNKDVLVRHIQTVEVRFPDIHM